MEFFLLLLLGIATGITGGYLGIGGALLITPVFLELLRGDALPDATRIRLAFGSSLLAISGTSLSAALTYARMRRVNWRGALLTGTTALVFSFIGSTIAARSPSLFLQVLFALFAVINAVLMLSPLKIHARGSQASHPAGIFVAIGMFAGMVSAMIGVAGGVLMVPLFLFWAKLPAEEAPGTSSAVGVLTSIAGCAGYIVNGLSAPDLPAGAYGYVMPALALPVLIGTVIGAPLGSKLNKHFGGGVFRKVFAFFLLVVAAKILFSP